MDAIQSAVDIAGTLGATISNFTENGFTARFSDNISIQRFMDLIQDTGVSVTRLDNRVVVTRS